jgi:mRNA interferase MazF
MLIPKRGEIYIVNFDPTVGSEISKTRPALILQNNIGNRYSPVTIVAAIGSHFKDVIYPTEVLIIPPEGGLSEKSVILLNQIRTIDKKRLVKKIGELNESSVEKINRAIEISLGLYYNI